MSADHQHLDGNMETDDALQRIKTAGSITISPELFEKIYLSPFTQVKGDLRKTVGNPTPLALVGFLLSLQPLSMDLMNFRQTQTGLGAATTGNYFFFGGLLMVIASVLEFIIGNTFPMLVFGSFGAFWFVFGATLQPFYNAYGAYAAEDPVPPHTGIYSPGFNNSFGFYTVTMGCLCVLYLILSARTNIIFFSIFFLLIPAFGLLTGAFFHIAVGDTTIAKTLIISAGALVFFICLEGWYLTLAIMLAALDFPFQLPVGDLSHIVKGASDRAQGA